MAARNLLRQDSLILLVVLAGGGVAAGIIDSIIIQEKQAGEEKLCSQCAGSNPKILHLCKQSFHTKDIYSTSESVNPCETFSRLYGIV